MVALLPRLFGVWWHQLFLFFSSSSRFHRHHHYHQSLSNYTIVKMAKVNSNTTSTTTATSPTTTATTTVLLTDEELIQRAEASFKEERLLEAARYLRQVTSKDKLNASSSSSSSSFFRKLLQDAKIVEDATKELLETPDGEWKKQGESSSGNYDTTIYYKLQEGSAKLTCRMETPVPTSLLIPLLSVLNESGLYHTWIPSWKRPFRIGVRQSKQLLNDTKGHQIIQVQCDVPWPMASREVLMDVIAVDDIDANGFIIAKMRTLDDERNCPLNFTIPPLERNMERADYDGAVLFRACPTDHVNYAAARKKFPNDDLILLQFAVYFDGHMALVPTAMINFVTRTVIGRVWNMLLSVAEEVREGTRKEHCEVIRKKAVFYKWVEERCQVMLDRMKHNEEEEEEDSSTKDTTTNTTDAAMAGTTTTNATEADDSSTKTTTANATTTATNSTKQPYKTSQHVAQAPTTTTTTAATTTKTCRLEELSVDDWTMKDVLKMSL